MTTRLLIQPFYLLLCLVIAATSCRQKKTEQTTAAEKGTYSYDADFLKKHLKQVTELTNEDGARVLVTGDYQGRVMTSSANGGNGNSFGWINYALIEQNGYAPQFNPVGGEERFWIGPEGGQFSFYFPKQQPFDFNNWQVPAFIDTLPYPVTSATTTEVTFSHRASIENYAGSTFDLDINRTIRLLGKEQLSERTGSALPEHVRWVAYETENNVKNAGSSPWTRESGLLSIWLLGMFTPSDETVSIIPFKNLPNAEEYITDSYFGAIPNDRLIRKDSVLLLKCDGKHRSKLGLSPAIAKPVAGSFDFHKKILTVILFDVDAGGDYVNSKWEIQSDPYAGDVVNSYNDGPLKDGSQMGPFYELESSSPARPLQPGETLSYKQVTAHFEGEYAALKTLAQNLLGVDLDQARMP